jgi:hypothetical protein
MELIGAGEGGGRIVIENINLSAIDTAGLKNLASEELAPILQDLMKDESMLVPPQAVREF